MRSMITFVKGLFCGAIICGVVWLAGFFWFVSTMERASSIRSINRGVTQADEVGVVALTGSVGRIEAGLDLINAQAGKRLLISGVYETTGKQALKDILGRDMPSYAALLDCCVDLGAEAKTTQGNALETYEWVRSNGYESIILVTTDYHMRRAKAHMVHLLPNVKIISFPVVSKAAPEEGWYMSAHAWRVLGVEFTKYTYVKLSHIFRGR